MEKRTKPIDDKLYVIAVISNPQRYNRRYQLYYEFRDRMHENEHVVMYTVEVAFGDRDFEVTSPDHPCHVQLRTNAEIWHKENMINIGVSRLPPSWKYVAWIDADIDFNNANWAAETMHGLQHTAIVQLFQTAVDLGPDGRALQIHNGFAWSYKSKAKAGKQYPFWHPGYAWACTRKAWDDMGGLIDWAILGAADHHMALAWIGRAVESVPSTISKGYKRKVRAFEKVCAGSINHSIGYVNGNIVHYWHGKKKDRKYVERWDVLIEHKYDPEIDIVRDWQGLYRLSGGKPGIIDDISRYFTQRQEDSIDD